MQSDIYDYQHARANLARFATGQKAVTVTQMQNARDVGIFIGEHERTYSQNSFGDSHMVNAVARKAFERVIDKLEPAIQSLFQRYLAEVLNEMQQVAIAAAKVQIARQEEEALELIASVERTYDSPD